VQGLERVYKKCGLMGDWKDTLELLYDFSIVVPSDRSSVIACCHYVSVYLFCINLPPSPISLLLSYSHFRFITTHFVLTSHNGGRSSIR